MGSEIPKYGRHRFHQEVERAFDEIGLDEALRAVTGEALWLHFEQLRLWNPRLSLIGPGTAGDVVGRHYEESLAAVPWIQETDRTLVDLGSGGGFPGLVMAVACPGLQVALVEPKQRKCAFLLSALRSVRSLDSLQNLDCQVCEARVENPLPGNLLLPPSIDVVTSRALALPPEIFEALHGHSPSARFLLWTGKENEAVLKDERIRRLYEESKRKSLKGSHGRSIVELSPRETTSK